MKLFLDHQVDRGQLPPLEVGADGGAKHDEIVVGRGTEAEDGACAQKERAQVERPFPPRRHPRRVGAHRGRHRVRKLGLGHGRHGQAGGARRAARRVFVGAEEHDAALGRPLRLHALENGLTVVEDLGRRGGGACGQAPTLPTPATTLSVPPVSHLGARVERQRAVRHHAPHVAAFGRPPGAVHKLRNGKERRGGRRRRARRGQSHPAHHHSPLPLSSHRRHVVDAKGERVPVDVRRAHVGRRGGGGRGGAAASAAGGEAAGAGRGRAQGPGMEGGRRGGRGRRARRGPPFSLRNPHLSAVVRHRCAAGSAALGRGRVGGRERDWRRWPPHAVAGAATATDAYRARPAREAACICMVEGASGRGRARGVKR